MAFRIDYDIEPVICGGLAAAPAHIRSRAALTLALGFTKSGDELTQIGVVQIYEAVGWNIEVSHARTVSEIALLINCRIASQPSIFEAARCGARRNNFRNNKEYQRDMAEGMDLTSNVL